jgi:hypothetical protein
VEHQYLKNRNIEPYDKVVSVSRPFLQKQEQHVSVYQLATNIAVNMKDSVVKHKVETTGCYGMQ